MNLIEKLAYKIGEGFQANAFTYSEEQKNLFYRHVARLQSTDLAFLNGLVATGSRGSAIINGSDLLNNIGQLTEACRLHLPLVVNVKLSTNEDEFISVSKYDKLKVIEHFACFQFIATTEEEAVHYNLIAHKIAEQALLPGVVILDYTSQVSETILPNDNVIKHYLGAPQDQIKDLTPAQKMLFGGVRRRIPSWVSLDNSVGIGLHKNDYNLDLENLANQKYFGDHLQEIISKCFAEYNQLLDLELAPLLLTGKSRKYSVIGYGEKVSSEFKNNQDKNTQKVEIKQLAPLPIEAIKAVLQNKKGLTVFDYTASNTREYSSFYYTLSHLIGSSYKPYCGVIGDSLNSKLLNTAIQHMLQGQPQRSYLLGFNFSDSSINFPKHQILSEEIEKVYPNIEERSLSHRNDSPTVGESSVAKFLQNFKSSGPRYASLARFYNENRFFLQDSKPIADPFASLPIAPLASAGLTKSLPSVLPQIDSSNCTGCGDCFVHCPHTALSAIAIKVEQLIRTGISLASNKGEPLTAITPYIKKISERVNVALDEDPMVLLNVLIPQSFEEVAKALKLPQEKQALVNSEIAKIIDEISGFPISITDNFFTSPRLTNASAEELFSIAVNASVCTGCSICEEVCAENAVSMTPISEDLVKDIDEDFALWEKLPDTTGDTIQRLHHDQDYSSIAALMLSRNYNTTFYGSSNTESNLASKSLLHSVAVTLEAVLQPKMSAYLDEVKSLINGLSSNIHESLASAIPDQDSDNLAQTIRQMGGQKMELGEVVNKLSEGEHTANVDSAVLGRKAELVEELKKLEWLISAGPNSNGRSRYTLLVASNNKLEWAKEFPNNSFTNASWVSSNGSSSLKMLGLVYGQLHYHLDYVKLTRRAKLEIKNKYEPSTHNKQISSLSWTDLTTEEKLLFPPIIVLTDSESLEDEGWTTLSNLIKQEVPINVICINDLCYSAQKSKSALLQYQAGLFSTLSLGEIFVFQGGMNKPNSMVNAIMEGLNSGLSSFLSLYAFKNTAHGERVSRALDYAVLAEESRTFPNIKCYKDANNGGLIGSIDLLSNKDYKRDWVSEKITLDNKDIEYEITWADWAYTQLEWADHFKELDDEATALPVAKYLALEKTKREQHVPVIIRESDNGVKYIAVSAAVVETCSIVLYNWNVLQELAGLKTKFPEKLHQEVYSELEKEFNQKVQQLEQNFANKLHAQEQNYTQELKSKLKQKLVALSMMAKRKD